MKTITMIDILGHVMTVRESLPENSRHEQVSDGREACSDIVIHDWSSVFKGQAVVVRTRRALVASGVVDEWMPNGSAVWIFIPKESRRVLIHREDGVILSQAY